MVDSIIASDFGEFWLPIIVVETAPILSDLGGDTLTHNRVSHSSKFTRRFDLLPLLLSDLFVRH